MKKRFFLKIALLVVLVVTVVKCTELVEDNSKKTRLDEKLNNAKNNKLTVNSKKKFSTNESLKFSVDTGTEEGFIYLVYVDKGGETSLLYPSDKSNQKKKSGKLKFPEDFGGADIKTTKDCKNCEKEKTTIVVLLSNDPIENIQNMNEAELIAMNTQTEQTSRDFSIHPINSSIMVNKFDFFVE
jgi:hypothetical protein